MASKNEIKDKTIATLAGMLSDLFHGKFLSVAFFKRYTIHIAFIVGMVLMYISNKYTCQKYMTEINQLKEQLESANTDWVNASAKYNSMIRESQMKAFVDTMHIHLIAPEQPPYSLDTK
ncbi:MAG: hypothetical protein HUK11_04650 [Muribaculaceae bacterium]|nr:hypothetical protein [Muribaculaceae bacterium]